MRQPVVARLEEIRAMMADTARTAALADIVGADDVERAWHGAGLDRQRTALSILFERIELHPMAAGAVSPAGPRATTWTRWARRSPSGGQVSCHRRRLAAHGRSDGPVAFGLRMAPARHAGTPHQFHMVDMWTCGM